MCSAIGAIGEGVLTNRIRSCILDIQQNQALRYLVNNAHFKEGVVLNTTCTTLKKSCGPPLD